MVVLALRVSAEPLVVLGRRVIVSGCKRARRKLNPRFDLSMYLCRVVRLCCSVCGHVVLAGRADKYMLSAMSQLGPVCGLVMVCCGFELLVRNWGPITLACMCLVQVEGMNRVVRLPRLWSW